MLQVTTDVLTGWKKDIHQAAQGKCERFLIYLHFGRISIPYGHSSSSVGTLSFSQTFML